ncbi:hypothetical protein BDV10DRAFT_166854 [Aspergillus recurvatus]
MGRYARRSGDLEYIRPAPRTKQACDSCRARKIRCLRDEKGAGLDVCRRCATYGYQCTYTPIRLRQPREGPLSKSQPVMRKDSEAKDIVSSLCKDNPSAPGGLSQILNMHRRVFHAKLPKDSSLCSNVTSMPTPELIGQPSQATGSSSDSPDANMNINMEEAEKLLAVFRQRRTYFPFVEIPEWTTAASMAVHRPFLLLAILTVASSRVPRLQQRTDERFRRVLSDRIVLHGEQSLDYVQGLLVYIAWFPLHLHPIRSRLFQYLAITNTMISDLELESFLTDTTNKARETCLACFSLTSHLSNMFPRRKRDSPESYFEPLRRLKPYLLSGTQMQYARVHDLAGRVTGYTPPHGVSKEIFDSRAAWKRARELHPNPNEPFEESEVRRKAKEFMGELAALEAELSPGMQDKIPIHLTILFIKLNITYLPIKPAQCSETKCKPELPANPDPDYSDAEILDVANSCFTDIKTFLESFLSVPLEECLHFSIREWSQLIVTISIASQLCFSRPETDDIPGWDSFQVSLRVKMLIYLESLSHRMGTLSVAEGLDSCPDNFAMFKSVLAILLETFAPGNTLGAGLDEVTTLSAGAPNHHGQGLTSILETQPIGSGSSRCPVMNGRIRQTDFWQALEQNTSSSDQDTITMGAFGDQQNNPLEEYSMDDLVEAPQDWPSIFSEWVVDLCNLSG